MSQPQIRGVSARDEARISNVRRDPRRIGQQITDAVTGPQGAAGALLITAVSLFFLPGLAHLTPLLIAWVLVMYLPSRRHRTLPMRLPIEAQTVDYGDPLPGRRKYRKSSGLMFVGNAVEYGNQELWSSRNDELTHALVIGTTGAGKTVGLTGMGCNYIAVGGGLIYTDAKASPGLAWDIGAIAFRCGREDDLLIINYMTGNRTVSGDNPERTSNTANPFTSGSADSCTQMLSSLVKEPEGDNAVFGERALVMVTSLMYGLVALRDLGHLDLGVSTIRDALPLEQFEAIAYDPRLDARPNARDAMRAYLKSLPNYKPPHERVAMDTRLQRPKKNADGSNVIEPIHEQAGAQHGFAQMYFTRSMSSLTDTYGHIYRGNLPEVDFVDVSRRRRILVTMLPALEKSPAELANLGKINLAALRDAISTGLGSGIEGRRKDVLDNLPTDSPIPSKIILDEYGYMAVDGFSIVAAQARGLGFSCLWAGQDWAGIKRGSEREAEQIWSNTTLKLFGRLEDSESFGRLKTALGESRVTQIQGYGRDGDSLSYRESQELTLEKTDRVDFVDLQEQIEGEAHLAWRGKLVRTRLFYADVPGIDAFRVNRYLRVGERSALSSPAPVAEKPEQGASAAGTGSSSGGPTAKPTSPPREASPEAQAHPVSAVPPRTAAARAEPVQAAPVRTEPVHPPIFDPPPPTAPPAVAHEVTSLIKPLGQEASAAPVPVAPPATTPPRRRQPFGSLEDALTDLYKDTAASPAPAQQPSQPLQSNATGLPPSFNEWTLPTSEEPPASTRPSTTSAGTPAPQDSPAIQSQGVNQSGYTQATENLDLADSLDVMELFEQGSRGHEALATLTERVIDSYPPASIEEDTSQLTPEQLMARIDGAIDALLGVDPQNLQNDDDRLDL